MEQLHAPSAATASSDPAVPQSSQLSGQLTILQRCRARNHSGRQCRLLVSVPSAGLCYRHAARVEADPERADLSAALFGPVPPTFQSAEEINAVLAQLVILVAQARISARRAAVMTYALSFILRGLQVIDKKAGADPVEIVLDIDSAAARHALAAAKSGEPTTNVGEEL